MSTTIPCEGNVQAWLFAIKGQNYSVYGDHTIILAQIKWLHIAKGIWWVLVSSFIGDGLREGSGWHDGPIKIDLFLQGKVRVDEHKEIGQDGQKKVSLQYSNLPLNGPLELNSGQCLRHELILTIQCTKIPE